MAETGLETPTQAELIDRISTDYDAQNVGENAAVRFSPGWVFARVMAGIARPLHSLGAYVMRQVLPTTCDETWLTHHAKIRGVDRIAATFASGDLDFTGTNGTTVSAGVAVQRVEDGEPGTVTTGGTVSGGSVTVTIQADNAGDAANSVAGVKWELASPIAGIDTEGEVNAVAPVAGGNDEEGVEDWRERVLDAWREPRGPGSVADFRKWAREVEVVESVFVTPNELGAGTVGVRFTVEPDYTDPTPSSTIGPSAADVTAVEAKIEEYAPVTADVTVTQITTTAQNFTITVNGGSPPTAVQDAVKAELDAMFIRLAEPGGTIYRSQYRAAISAADGELYHDVSSPAGDITAGADEVFSLGTVIFL